MIPDLQLDIGAMIREHDALVSKAETASDAEGSAQSEHAGMRFGSYTLLECIGEGGFGAVWRAQQNAPVKRQVALKILKAGMDTREVIARFEQERQALAVMDDPNIARVLDAGATPGGRPFFVMELVRGLAITRFCDEKKLSTRERLQLFMEVCLAVQHAHQKGIIHRDLKPTNLLVSEHEGRAQVKVIDFGIAKATGEALTDLTIVTQLHRLIGTPAYMSPEQITGAQDVDTRSDIYSLGVVLYELLTGRTPFEPKDLLAAGREGMMQMLRERPAPKPSTRLKTLDAAALQGLAANRQTGTPEFIRLLRGDLDAIVMKALEKERDRRYDAANALRADVERFLKNEPVLARAPSAAYVLRQFARRNRAAVLGVAAVLLAILVGLATSTYLFFRERAARAVADAEVAKSRQVSRFLEDTLASAGVSKSLGRDATMMREVLDNTAERIGRELAGQPEVEAELRGAIGGAYQDIDEYSKANEHLGRALELRRRQFAGRDDVVLAKAIVDYAASLEKLGQFAKVVPIAREGIAMLERTVGPEHPETADALSELAWSLMKSGHAAEAHEPAQRAMKVWERTPDDDRLSEVPKTLACILMHLKKGAESEAIYRRAVEAVRRHHGPEHPQLVVELDNFGMQLVNNGKFDEAEQILNECLSQGRKFYGDRNPYADHALARLAVIAARRGDEEKQLELLREGVAAARRVFANDHPYRKEALNQLVKALQTQAEKFEKSTVPGDTEKAQARREELRRVRDE
jgi:serine/threonine protein kinase/Tfp pilus assembly protein PilF